jgi:hypothetical protein
MRYLILWSLLALLLITIMPGASQFSDTPTIINLMIDAQMPSSPTKEQASEAEKDLENIYNQINERGLIATIFSAQDVLRTDLNLDLTRIGYLSKFELGMSGNKSNEKISTMSYADQIALLKVSKRWVESCMICGKNNVTVFGFMPQSFDQNQDTYKALDELGIQYDAGFQAGLLYTPGHENDIWPYQVAGHKFYAVPVSTYNLSDKMMVLQDSYFVVNDMDATQWYDALVGKFDEIQGKDEPMVVSLTTSVSGSGDYLDSLKRFMDYAVSKKASFVTTADLVSLAKTSTHDASSLPSNVTMECPTCDQNENLINITAFVSINESIQAANNTTQAIAPESIAASK